MPTDPIHVSPRANVRGLLEQIASLYVQIAALHRQAAAIDQDPRHVYPHQCGERDARARALLWTGFAAAAPTGRTLTSQPATGQVAA